MNVTPEVQPVYLSGAGGEPFLGLLHGVAKINGGAVLICPPFGWADVCSYRARRAWAEHLAREGHPTLRIDLPASGDSSGEPDDRDRLGSWSDAVATAAQWLLSVTDSPSVAAIGIGLGGLVLCKALAERAPIDEIVLWGTPSRGKTLVRELRALARMESPQLAVAGEREAVLPADDSVEVGGFPMSGETARTLDCLDVGELALAQPPRRALLIGRDGLDADARLLEQLRDAGVDVGTAPGPGYGAMMAEPQEARSPHEVFATVAHWLDQAPANTPAPRASAAVPSSAAELELGEATVRERAMAVEFGGGRLFGILATPASAAPAPLAAVILNAGAIRHIGPGRMWVEIARRWASRGVATLRLDLEGIGDADGDETRFSRLAELYVPEMVDQVLAALDVLEREAVAQRFVLVGLCSGSFWSFHAALRDRRVTAALMLNPQTLFWDASLETTRALRKAFLHRSSWLRLIRGQVKPARLVRLVRRMPAGAAAGVRRVRMRRAARLTDSDPLDLALAQLARDDKRAVFIFSGEEPLRDELLREDRMRQLESEPQVRVEYIPGTDHTLRPPAARAGAHAALDRALERELERIHTTSLR